MKTHRGDAGACSWVCKDHAAALTIHVLWLYVEPMLNWLKQLRQDQRRVLAPHGASSRHVATLESNCVRCVVFDVFDYGREDTNNDRITVEWCNTPDGAAKQFRREWFQGDGMVRRKNLPIEYNP
ncbi:unnamed protein product [Heligmosomoides polygyrus]|uniref:MSP domain-containing protein n=1 Tax=Heligmosomoides polygyrus TaxID=6339 RepID=A0A183FEW3_HELPZ|nr:unnamed protein product [Heligmosomoides polygyrus]